MRKGLTTGLKIVIVFVMAIFVLLVVAMMFDTGVVSLKDFGLENIGVDVPMIGEG